MDRVPGGVQRGHRVVVIIGELTEIFVDDSIVMILKSTAREQRLHLGLTNSIQRKVDIAAIERIVCGRKRDVDLHVYVGNRGNRRFGVRGVSDHYINLATRISFQ